MTRLSFHDRLHVLGPVDATVTAALVATFGIQATASADLETVAARFLNELRDGQRWLACGCVDADPPPLLAPRLREGAIHIFRFGETQHAAGCPFHVEVTEDHAAGSRPPAAIGAMTPWTGGWLQVGKEANRAGDRQPPPDDEAVEGTTRKAPPALQRMLYSALREVGYTELVATDIVTRPRQKAGSAGRDAYAALEALDATPIAPGLVWKDVGCRYMPAFPRFIQKHLPSIIDRFPPDTRPQGVFLGIVHEITKVSPTRTQLLWRAGKDQRAAVLEVDGPVRFSGYAANTAGPFWVMVQVAYVKALKAFRPIRAYAHPCLSKAVLLPVDSGFERETAEILLQQLTYWAKPDALGAVVQLEKPLFDEASSSGEYCRPDFVLWLPNRKRILVESMGMKTDEYLASKAASHPRMRALVGAVDLVEHHPGDDPFEFAKRLTGAVRKGMR